MDLSREQRKVEWRELRTVLLLIPCVLGTAMATGLISMLISVVVSVVIGIWGNGYGGYWSVPQGWLVGTTSIGLALILLGVVVKRAELKKGPRVVAQELGGRLLSKGGSEDVLLERLRNVVSELAVVMGTKEPAIYVLEREPEINAFALGKEIDDSMIVVTQGALENLKRSELQAVLAHEFFHILNGDSKFNMWLTTWIYGVLLIYILGTELLGRCIFIPNRWFWSNATIGVGEVLFSLLFLVFGVGFFAVGLVGAFLARLLQRSLIRHHEFRADLGALNWTREPAALRSAFRMIERHGSRVHSSMASEVGHCFFAEWGNDAFPVKTHPTFTQRRAKISRVVFKK